jgi:hypothetical protein
VEGFISESTRNSAMVCNTTPRNFRCALQDLKSSQAQASLANRPADELFPDKYQMRELAAAWQSVEKSTTTVLTSEGGLSPSNVCGISKTSRRTEVLNEVD